MKKEKLVDLLYKEIDNKNKILHTLQNISYDEYDILSDLDKELYFYKRYTNACNFHEKHSFVCMNSKTCSISKTTTYVYTLVKESFTEDDIIFIKRNFIKDLLQPKDEYPRDVDCKNLELFFDDIIDWETLRKLTYANCSALQ